MLRAKDVGAINKHGATIGINYCRCDVDVQKLYCIESVCTMFSTGHCLYLSTARYMQTL
jgi:hypothetical protein